MRFCAAIFDQLFPPLPKNTTTREERNCGRIVLASRFLICFSPSLPSILHGIQLAPSLIVGRNKLGTNLDHAWFHGSMDRAQNRLEQSSFRDALGPSDVYQLNELTLAAYYI